MARLDERTTFPSGMEEYLSYYGWHFSKKMCEWATSMMYREENGKKKSMDPYTRETMETLLRQYGIPLGDNPIYDAVYVGNMCRADYYGTSVKTEGDLAQFVGDTLNDPDGYEGMVFTRFYADCVGSGKGIDWEDML